MSVVSGEGSGTNVDPEEGDETHVPDLKEFDVSAIEEDARRLAIEAREKKSRSRGKISAEKDLLRVLRRQTETLQRKSALLKRDVEAKQERFREKLAEAREIGSAEAEAG